MRDSGVAVSDMLVRFVQLEVGYRLDLPVDDAVAVKLKATTKPLNIHHAQLLSYLRLRQLKVGLLINFHVCHLRDGVRRIVNGA